MSLQFYHAPVLSTVQHRSHVNWPPSYPTQTLWYHPPQDSHSTQFQTWEWLYLVKPTWLGPKPTWSRL